MEPEDYQEQQDSLNINDRTWRDGSSGSMGGTPSNKKEGASSSSMGLEKRSKKPLFSIVDYEKQLEKWSSPEFKEGYQALLDEIEKEAQAPEKEEPESKQGAGNLIDVIRKQAEEEAVLEQEQGSEEENLPTAKELSERFGGSFAPILERFKEQIRFEIEDGTRAAQIPMDLEVLASQMSYIFESAVDSTKLKMKDTEPILSKKVFLEMCRVDMKILDTNAADPFTREGSGTDTYWIVDKESCRDLDKKGIVTNPGIGNNWIELQFYDELNDRTLDVYFKVYLQIPKK